MTEREFMAAVVQLARASGWLVYHTFDSRRSQPGFPDLVLVRERVMFRELKVRDGKLSLEQRTWLARLRSAGADAAVWRERDWATVENDLKRTSR